MIIPESCIEFVIDEKIYNEPCKLESTLTIKSLFNHPIAVRIKTTKKDLYAVTPTYLKLEPAEETKILLAYFKGEEGKIKDIGSHKFKFDAISAEGQTLNNIEDVKKYFEAVINSKNKILGTVIKKGIYHKIIKSKESKVGDSEVFNSMVETNKDLKNSTVTNYTNTSNIKQEVRHNYYR